jgi:hypothetical protein
MSDNAIVENGRREFAEDPLSAVTADAHCFPFLVKSAPVAAVEAGGIEPRIRPPQPSLELLEADI